MQAMTCTESINGSWQCKPCTASSGIDFTHRREEITATTVLQARPKSGCAQFEMTNLFVRKKYLMKISKIIDSALDERVEYWIHETFDHVLAGKVCAVRDDEAIISYLKESIHGCIFLLNNRSEEVSDEMQRIFWNYATSDCISELSGMTWLAMTGEIDEGLENAYHFIDVHSAVTI